MVGRTRKSDSEKRAHPSWPSGSEAVANGANEVRVSKDGGIES